MKHKDFEDYLIERHLIENPSILDDDCIEAFEHWISNFDIDDWLKYGDMYAKTLTKGAEI